MCNINLLWQNSHGAIIFNFNKRKMKVYYVVDHNDKANHHHGRSTQFFYSPNICFYPLALINSLSLDLNWFDLA